MPKLLHVFLDADMRCRHEGLFKFMKTNRVNPKTLRPGDIVAFLNRRKDRLMVIGVLDEENSYGVLAYYRSPSGRVAAEAIQYIPKVFGGMGLDMGEAVRKSLIDILSRKGKV